MKHGFLSLPLQVQSLASDLTVVPGELPTPLHLMVQSFKSSSLSAAYPHLSFCFDFMSRNSSRAPLDCYVDRLSARGTEPSR